MNDGNEIPQRVRSLHDLATSDFYPVGTRVFVAEDGYVYISVGTTTSEIATLLGWQQQNVWMPEHALRHIQDRHETIVDPIAASFAILSQPMSVHLDHSDPENKRTFYADGDMLRDTGLLTSQTTRYVSAGVELRYASGAVLLRLFHLSPHRIIRGERLWP